MYSGGIITKLTLYNYFLCIISWSTIVHSLTFVPASISVYHICYSQDRLITHLFFITTKLGDEPPLVGVIRWVTTRSSTGEIYEVMFCDRATVVGYLYIFSRVWWKEKVSYKICKIYESSWIVLVDYWLTKLEQNSSQNMKRVVLTSNIIGVMFV